MSKVIAKTQVQKKTYNIELQNIKDMESFIAPRKQTAFVNKAIRLSLDQMKKEKNKQEALQALQDLSKMRTKADMSDGKDSVELVRELRHERVERLISNIEENE